ncbi:uncharacterized protein V1516DRAFT_626523 [Lipomyces oligophaga]|uniref:uncharacterized protein n=1 Tax=Lipomyces oligophaga TaxID=45792 RepID=UPI0034CDD94B
MGKGFSNLCDEILGWDIKVAFMQACTDAGLNAELCAIVNDSVAVVLSELQVDPKTKIGLIVGTGLNASIKVATTSLDEDRLAHCNPLAVESSEECIVNTELSLFGGQTGVLPLTRWDREIDNRSEKPGFQPLEQLCSGRYIPEIARCILRDRLFKGRDFSLTGFDKEYGVDSLTMSIVEGEPDTTFARQQLLARHPIQRREVEARTTPLTTFSVMDIRVMKSVFYAVSCRAAAIVAASLVALAAAGLSGESVGDEVGTSRARGSEEVVIVAVTGSVIEYYSGFRQRVQGFVDLLCRRQRISSRRLVLKTAEKSALWGAAVAAASNSKQRL